MGQIKIPNNASVFQAYANSADGTSTPYMGFNVYSGLNKSGASLFNLIYSTGNPAYGLSLFKGTPPTQAALDAMSTVNYATSNAHPRYADMLLTLPGVSANYVNNVMQATLSPASAIASGTATWFMLWCSHASYLTSGFSGSVGLSGSDLDLLTTSIVSGQLYKLPTFSMSFPTKFTW